MHNWNLISIVAGSIVVVAAVHLSQYHQQTNIHNNAHCTQYAVIPISCDEFFLYNQLTNSFMADTRVVMQFSVIFQVVLTVYIRILLHLHLLIKWLHCLELFESIRKCNYQIVVCNRGYTFPKAIPNIHVHNTSNHI